MWIKSSYSNGGANCLELALHESTVALRDSKAPALGPLTIPNASFAALLKDLTQDRCDL
ncbi:DUF397 domain-containing protein [Streptomyces acidiscabies]|uniref:Toxin-antitoxin system, toxin component n=1 Tax=Streptomyces acidiscabies TaxID=42234 RepID=A0A0L0KNX3_9ACTN|nr:DUF397 domain-containing protein [Streptomyces acidiscabies]KND39249.1 toxin-antitoxin system, toxin component [Streptomyces acidiscabies]